MIMGKLRKGYNWRARHNREPEDERTEEKPAKKIKLDIEIQDEKYDSSNVFMLESKKKETRKLRHPEKKAAKPLTKKEKKKLKQVISSREKKALRVDLLEKLKAVQALKGDSKLLTSIPEMQTKGLKKHFNQSQSNKPISSLRKAGKLQTFDQSTAVKDGSVVGFDVSSSSSDLDDSESEDDSIIGQKQDKALPALSNSSETTSVLSNSKEIKSSLKTNCCTPEDQNIVLTEKTTLEDVKILPSLLTDSKVKERKSAVFVPVNREKHIQEGRLKLPILSEEQMIMEAINENPVVIICGETGSGKTTQVPQFLFEAGYAVDNKIIGITEPRRIAAISMADRVGKEMNLTSKEVSYQIRFQGNTTDETKIKFMTDGVLLKEMQKDFLLTRYSAIIIDEAHERSVYSDILIGLLSRIVPLRTKRDNPLKLIIMSATLRVEDFAENNRLFKIPSPVLRIDARQFPVTVHFNKKTTDDYVAQAFKKVCKIHRQLPEGGILVFVTGQQEVNSLCHKLRRTFPTRSKTKPVENSSDKKEENFTNEKSTVTNLKQNLKEHSKRSRFQRPSDNLSSVPKINLDHYSADPLDEEELCEANENDDADLDDSEDETFQVEILSQEPLYVLPLYSLLPPDRQARVFGPIPPGSRLCVIATNVAETSLTIPNIKYVVDSGKVKARLYDKVTGVSAFNIQWTSKASSDQRAGRAGRTAPGHCYRLFSSAVFVDEFEMYSAPEITRKPVDDLLLQMKALGIDNVINFPFPSAPDNEALQAAEKRLIMLGALEAPPQDIRFNKANKSEWSAKVTPLGRAMSSFPLSPRYAKMLTLSHQHNLLPYMIAIVAALAIQDIFMDSQLNDDDESEEKHTRILKQNKWKQILYTWAGTGQSLALGDVMVLLKAVGAFEYANGAKEFCELHGLRLKAMTEIRKLRIQLTNEVNLAIVGLNLSVDPKMAPPSDLQCKLLRQLVLTGLFDQIARKIPSDEISHEDKKILKNAYMSTQVEQPVFIHPKSVLSQDPPEYVMYQEIFETSKMFMRGLCAVEPEWLPLYGQPMCRLSEPLDNPPPSYDIESDRILCHMTSTFGPLLWNLPMVELDYPESLDRFKWFSLFFLSGKVFTSLEKYKAVLLTNPSTMIKSWARLQPRTESFLQAVASESVDSKEKLVHLWKEKPKCKWQ